MTISAIIAEFNPLHNGHKYILDKSKDNSDFTIVLMSGDYVQRGEPALFNKYIRTRMALLNGADLVLELPTAYSLSSAEGFAKGAINILNSLNSVNKLIFGAECDDISILKNIADSISHIKGNDDRINSLIKKGFSYPAALAQTINIPNADNIINNPNNILAIEYLRALSFYDSNVMPCPVLRNDNGYNSITINSDNAYTSATSIRKNIFDEGFEYLEFIPSNTHTYYQDSITRLMSLDDFSDVMYYKLLSLTEFGYKEYKTVNEELSSKIIKNLKNYDTLSNYVQLLKSKNITYSRICRALFNILLDIKIEDDYSSPSYVRILGFKKDSQKLLNYISKQSLIPVISRCNDAPKSKQLSLESRSSHLYEQISGEHINEYRMSPIII